MCTRLNNISHIVCVISKLLQGAEKFILDPDMVRFLALELPSRPKGVAAVLTHAESRGISWLYFCPTGTATSSL